MSAPSVSHHTFSIERTYPAPAARVFAAFTDPVQKRRWFAGGEKRSESHELDFRVGGFERTRSRGPAGSPIAGALLGNDTTYQDIVPDQRIVFAYTMSLNGNRFSASLATVELIPEDGGTRLVFTEQGAYFEGADGPDLRKGGWEKLLDSLGREFAA